MGKMGFVQESMATDMHGEPVSQAARFTLLGIGAMN